MEPTPHETRLRDGQPWFATTHWSVVLTAREDALPQAEEALERLCQTYWYPLYAFFRRQGCSPHDAEDLVQGFFHRLLEKKFLEAVDRRKGKFRSFLLAAAKHYLADARKHDTRQKRGGTNRALSLDVALAENRYRHEPADTVTAETLFDRRWALTLLDEAMDRLEGEHKRIGKEALFARLQPFLLGDAVGVTYREVASSLQMSEGAVKVAVHRLRARYQSLLREQVAQTVASSEEVDEEIDHLVEVLRR
jgi:RNA polymerase sigma factor (sigma-70 family)